MGLLGFLATAENIEHLLITYLPICSLARHRMIQSQETEESCIKQHLPEKQMLQVVFHKNTSLPLEICLFKNVKPWLLLGSASHLNWAGELVDVSTPTGSPACEPPVRSLMLQYQGTIPCSAITITGCTNFLEFFWDAQFQIFKRVDFCSWTFCSVTIRKLHFWLLGVGASLTLSCCLA